MLQSFYSKTVSFLLLCIVITLFTQVNSQVQSQQLENLKAFTKLYGYIRFFHPSDEASKIDWNKFAVYGVAKVRNAKNDEELKEILKQLFLAIAPTVRIYSADENPKEYKEKIPEDTSGLKLVAWQHLGVGLSAKSTAYKSKKVFFKYFPYPSAQNFNPLNKSASYQNNQIREWYSGQLFQRLPSIKDFHYSKLNTNIFCIVPLVLEQSSISSIETMNNNAIRSLSEKIQEIDFENPELDKTNIWLANIIITWNVLQHFYPYFDVEKIDWESELTGALIEAFQDITPDDHYFTLRRMIAKLQDGHGYVLFDKEPIMYGLPIHVQLIEDQVTVVYSEIPAIQKGDIILKVGSRTANEEIVEKENLVGGSPQFKLYRAFIEFGNEKLPNNVIIELLRDGKKIEAIVGRKSKSLSSFFARPNEFNYEPIKKIENDIYYVNLIAADDNKFYDSLKNIANAKAVIFDYRRTGKFSQDTKRLITLQMIMHLIDSTLQSPRWNIPTVIYPDRKDYSFQESNWKLHPNQPKISGKKVFIIDSNVISHMETFMSFVEFYKLGDIVGQPSAGCNGNVNYIPLIGGFEIMFTGMKVLKPDGSQHHLIGIQPTHPVKRTIQAVKEGRDEYLEKAIEVIKASINK
ncbi:MAG: S41 family peptidase [Melioribacteraceae bacterium]|nr:S41 family peptidase [Melioribacteraceae bacterium]